MIYTSKVTRLVHLIAMRNQHMVFGGLCDLNVGFGIIPLSVLLFLLEYVGELHIIN